MKSNSNKMTSTAQGGVNVGITNNLSIDVDIYDVFNPSTGSSTLPYVYTKLGTIAKGTTGSVTTIRQASMLQAMYTGIIAELAGNYYYQFPIKIMSGTQFSFGTPAPLAYTIAESDRLSMIQSFTFHKFATANPSSALTQNLYTALKAGDPTAINSYFAGTANFKNCTYGSWNAVMAWMNMFTCAWQGPYYLYETAPTPLPANYTPVLLATLNIVSTAQNNSATLTMCSADASGNPIYANPPQTTVVVMAGDGSMTDANPGTDVTTSLSPVWMNVVQSSMQNGTPVANYLIGSAVCGTIAGQNVVSSQTARQAPGKPADPSKQSSFDSIFNHLCSAVGLLAGLLMVYEFVAKKAGESSAAKEKAKADATSETDFKQKSDTIDSAAATDIATDCKANSTTIETNSSGVSGDYGSISDSMKADTMTQAMDASAQTINEEFQTQIENGLTPSAASEEVAQNIADGFTEVKADIASGNLNDAATKLETVSTTAQQAIQQQESQMAESETTALDTAAETTKTASEATDALDTAEETRANDMKDASTDSGFNEEDATTPPETEEL